MVITHWNTKRPNNIVVRSHSVSRSRADGFDSYGKFISFSFSQSVEYPYISTQCAFGKCLYQWILIHALFLFSYYAISCTPSCYLPWIVNRIPHQKRETGRGLSLESFVDFIALDYPEISVWSTSLTPQRHLHLYFSFAYRWKAVSVSFYAFLAFCRRTLCPFPIYFDKLLFCAAWKFPVCAFFFVFCFYTFWPSPCLAMYVTDCMPNQMRKIKTWPGRKLWGVFDFHTGVHIPAFD